MLKAEHLGPIHLSQMQRPSHWLETRSHQANMKPRLCKPRARTRSPTFYLLDLFENTQQCNVSLKARFIVFYHVYKTICSTNLSRPHTSLFWHGSLWENLGNPSAFRHPATASINLSINYFLINAKPGNWRHPYLDMFGQLVEDRHFRICFI